MSNAVSYSLFLFADIALALAIFQEGFTLQVIAVVFWLALFHIIAVIVILKGLKK